MNKKVCEAFMFAMRKHTGQRRKYTGEMYFVHPVKVYEVLRLVCDDPDILCAGLLHDVLEDTKTTYDELSKRFGKRVADIVMEVTKEKRGIRNVLKICTREGMMVKIADILSNVCDCPDESYIKKKADFINELLCDDGKTLHDIMELDSDLSSIPHAK